MGGYELNFKVDPTSDVVNKCGNCKINNDLECTNNNLKVPFEPFEANSTNLKRTNSNIDLKDSFRSLNVKEEEIEIVQTVTTLNVVLQSKLGIKATKLCGTQGQENV